MTYRSDQLVLTDDGFGRQPKPDSMKETTQKAAVLKFYKDFSQSKTQSEIWAETATSMTGNRVSLARTPIPPTSTPEGHSATAELSPPRSQKPGPKFHLRKGPSGAFKARRLNFRNQAKNSEPRKFNVLATDKLDPTRQVSIPSKKDHRSTVQLGRPLDLKCYKNQPYKILSSLLIKTRKN